MLRKWAGIRGNFRLCWHGSQAVEGAPEENRLNNVGAGDLGVFGAAVDGQRLASVRISPSPSSRSSAVARVKSRTCAVAARMRSAGS